MKKYVKPLATKIEIRLEERMMCSANFPGAPFVLVMHTHVHSHTHCNNTVTHTHPHVDGHHN